MVNHSIPEGTQLPYIAAGQPNSEAPRPDGADLIDEMEQEMATVNIGHLQTHCPNPPAPEPPKPGRNVGSSGKIRHRATFVPTRHTVDELRDAQVLVGPDINRILGQSVNMWTKPSEKLSVRRTPGVAHGSFEELELQPFLMSNIREASFDHPTPIEYFGIPKMVAMDPETGLLMHEAMIWSSQTGAGKTTAYVLGLLELLARGEAPREAAKNPRACQPRAIIIASIHELAEQIANEGRKFAAGSGLHVEALYGGTLVNNCIDRLDKNIDIVVATIGRLHDFMERGLLDTSRLEYLVVDEFHEFVDSWKSASMTIDFNRFLNRLGDFAPASERPYAVLLTSAAMNMNLRRVGKRLLTIEEFEYVGADNHDGGSCYRPIYLNDNDPENLDVFSISVGRDMTANPLIEQNFVDAREIGRNGILDRIEAILREQFDDLEELDRAQNYKDFSDGRIPVLVATNAAANGLDFGARGVQHVINFELPSTYDHKFTYIERIGRTGRAGKPGRATTFFVDDLTDDVPQFILDTANGLDSHHRRVGVPNLRMAEHFLLQARSEHFLRS
ncbi:unnamed protein product, partial [Mesorhabditis spiculigera]